MNNEVHDRQFANQVCHVLSRGAVDLDPKVVASLYAARQEALRRQPEPVAALSLAGMERGIDRFVVRPMQDHFRGVLALLALVFGAMGVQFWQDLQTAAELAEIDSNLLSDEVSPSAYLDQGFMEWLTYLSQQEDDSSPQ